MYRILSVVLLLLQSGHGANILVVSHTPSPSHYMWNRALAYGLMDKGHNITLIAPDEDDSPKSKNLTRVLLEGVYETLHEEMGLNPNDMLGSSPIRTLFNMQLMSFSICDLSLSSKNFRNFLDSNDGFKFDLIIIDVTVGGCFYPIIHCFHYPPTIGVTPFLLPSYLAYNFGNHMYPSYIPWHSLPYNGEMTFLERVYNLFLMHVEVAMRYLYQYRQENAAAREYFGKDISTTVELERHISLILTNTDPILDFVQPLAPNFIPVGGLHTRKAKKLPEDLQMVLDSAKNGAIVFSLGTNVRSDRLDENTKKIIQNAFSKIPETVIWKYESDANNLPKNVIIRKWLPQNDLLGHPNVKLFIGHGGALCTQEAIFHGVPITCVPFYIDQFLNTQNVVKKKMGLALDLRNITSDTLYKTVREVLDNPVYSENTKKSSKRFRDRMETPLERGVFWAEYTMRHRGTQFLNTPARDLPAYKASGLDILVFVATVFVLCIIIVFRIVKVFRTKKVQNKVKTN